MESKKREQRKELESLLIKASKDLKSKNEELEELKFELDSMYMRMQEVQEDNRAMVCFMKLFLETHTR